MIKTGMTEKDHAVFSTAVVFKQPLPQTFGSDVALVSVSKGRFHHLLGNLSGKD